MSVIASDGLSHVRPRAIVIMGVSGSGKSTLGQLLANTLPCRFLEGDSYHSIENVKKMRAGHSLGDEDRWPWLDRLGVELNHAVKQDGISVAACSALKRSYRSRLIDVVGESIAFVFLNIDLEEAVRRLTARNGHYMPACLAASQMETLEVPEADENALHLCAVQTPETLCRSTMNWLEF